MGDTQNDDPDKWRGYGVKSTSKADNKELKILCPHCLGTKQVEDPYPDVGPFADKMDCPSCFGQGTIVAMEQKPEQEPLKHKPLRRQLILD